MSEEINSENSNESGPTPQTETPDETGTVAITDASDEELQAFLDNAQGKETEPEQQEEKVVEEPENLEESKELKEENSEEPTQEEDEDSATKKIRELEEQVQKLSKQNETDQKFIQQRGTEIGKLRQKNSELEKAYEQLNQKIQETKDDDPYEASVMRQKAEEIAREHRANDTQIQAGERELQNEQVLLRHFKPGDIETEDIVKVLEEDGIDDNFINEFARNPLGALSPVEFLHVTKRAYDLKHRGSLLSQKEQRIAELEKQLEAAKKQPDQLLQKVQQAGRLSNGVRSKTGGSTAGANPTLTPTQLANLSPAEFEKIRSSYL